MSEQDGAHFYLSRIQWSKGEKANEVLATFQDCEPKAAQFYKVFRGPNQWLPVL